MASILNCDLDAWAAFSMPQGPNGPQQAESNIQYASQPEISQLVRAAQKDDFHMRDLQDLVDNVFRGIIGPRRWQLWSSEVKLGTKLLYFSLTTLAGTQTLGEEYVDILQSGAAKQRIPRRRQHTLVATHILLPYLIAALYTRLRRYARQQQASQDSIQQPVTKWQRIRHFLLSLNLPAFDSLMQDHIRPVHLALFFLFGRYYSLSKRWLRIRYVSTKRPAVDSSAPSYEVLGVLMAIQILTKAGMSVHGYLRPSPAVSDTDETSVTGTAQKTAVLVDGKPLDQATFDPEQLTEEEPEEDEDEDEPVPRCMLCLSKRKVPTCAECGHVFCWTCIVGWARDKKDCPLCRQPVEMSRLLPLLNI